MDIPPPIYLKFLQHDTVISFWQLYDKTIHELGADDYGKFDSAQDK